jgi:hypothetical protein
VSTQKRKKREKIRLMVNSPYPQKKAKTKAIGGSIAIVGTKDTNNTIALLSRKISRYGECNLPNAQFRSMSK